MERIFLCRYRSVCSEVLVLVYLFCEAIDNPHMPANFSEGETGYQLSLSRQV